jgi:trk system potassium uptake protein TrkA
MMKIVVVGGGRLGEMLSGVLARERHDVVLIEKDGGLAEELAERLDVLVLQGDGSDGGLLRDANIESSDAVIAATGDDKANLAVCRIAKAAKVGTIISRMNRAESEKDFAKAGIESAIDATATAALAFKKAMERPERPLVGFVAGGGGEIFEVRAAKETKICGMTVAEAAKDFSIACVFRDGRILLPKPETKIKEGDILTVCAPVEDAKRIDAFFRP